jgi:hypothetical protein
VSPPVRLEPRGDRPAPVVFREGATAPYGIRWYGATSLWGHFRNLVSTAIAREAVDARDWMRPASPEETLRAGDKASPATALGGSSRGELGPNGEPPAPGDPAKPDASAPALEAAAR